MGLQELVWRVADLERKTRWRARAGEQWPVAPVRAGALVLAAAALPPIADANGLVTAAEAVLAGDWANLGHPVTLSCDDLDWHRDSVTGAGPAPSQFAFDIPYRSERKWGNVKRIWEKSRLHHVTLLAAAYHASADARFAVRALAELDSWWRANPPLQGINWVSGIEVGLRLIGWTWTRRLLSQYPGIADRFELNKVFCRQLHAHQSFLVSFGSRGSSANNHLVAELAGLLVSARAFPLFTDSGTWAAHATAGLEQAAVTQTFPDGLNRELASEYHGFVLDLFLCAGVEADHAGSPLSDMYWRRLRGMADALAALVDGAMANARQGDGDDGRALLLGSPTQAATVSTLAASARLFGAAPWWPAIPKTDPSATLLTSIGQPRLTLSGSRPKGRTSHFPAAGVTILRAATDTPDEVWCRLDHGPHGFLSTAAHAHADALSIELRVGGQEVLVDPGTYCYHGEKPWRDYFRSTLAHNTLQIAGRDQATAAGPFLWLTHPATHLHGAAGVDEGTTARVHASHDGYRTLPGAPRHHRHIALNRVSRALRVTDWVETTLPVNVRLAFHLHPDVSCRLHEGRAYLSWQGRAADYVCLTLSSGLEWGIHCGEEQPVLGWYSARFGVKQASTSLVGAGQVKTGQTLATNIAFGEHSSRGECIDALASAEF
jgi:Heparinase II/III-like protein/Heparinase II/III N-terminus